MKIFLFDVYFLFLSCSCRGVVPAPESSTNFEALVVGVAMEKSKWLNKEFLKNLKRRLHQTIVDQRMEWFITDLAIRVHPIFYPSSARNLNAGTHFQLL